MLPYLGVFVYLIARGHKMSEHAIAGGRRPTTRRPAPTSSRPPARPASAADELARLADLKDKGVIDDAEFAAMKAKIIG